MIDIIIEKYKKAIEKGINSNIKNSDKILKIMLEKDLDKGLINHREFDELMQYLQNYIVNKNEKNNVKPIDKEDWGER